MLDLVDDSGVKQNFHCNRLIWVQNTLLDEVSDLFEVYLLEAFHGVESVRSETTLGQSLSKPTLTAFEAEVNGAARPSVGSLVASSCRFPGICVSWLV